LNACHAESLKMCLLIIGGRDIKYFCRRNPISDIDIALSDIAKKNFGLKAFSPISDQSDNETAYSDIGQSATRYPTSKIFELNTIAH
jgi:hypothetical protein